MSDLLTLFLFSTIFLGLMCMGCHSENSTRNRDVEAIQKLHETDMAAAKIFDIHTLISLWTDDGILLQPGQEPIVGKEALWKYLNTALEQQKQYEIIEYVQHFEEIKIIDDHAYEWGTFVGLTKSIAGGEEKSHRSRLFRILRRQTDGSWKVARAIWHALPSDRNE